jgi:hypothetical protein
VPHLSWNEALVLSISSFHGRGFFTSSVTLGDTLARPAALEAVVGLLLEITFIAPSSPLSPNVSSPADGLEEMPLLMLIVDRPLILTPARGYGR